MCKQTANIVQNIKIHLIEEVMDLYHYLSSSESDDESNLYLIRRRIRDKSNPLALPRKEFTKRFRLSKEAFQYVLSNIHFQGHMSTSVPPILQLAATLTLLASGSFQHNVGNDFLLGLGQSTMCKIIKNVCKEIEEKLCPKHITFLPDDSAECMEYFITKYGIPGVIGCVDGTHFGLQKPTINEHMFFNRKGYHSINSLIICDHDYKILAINSQYGGAAHDSFIWKHSNERKCLSDLYEKRVFRNGWLLGDSGYPLEPWCLTPYRAADDGTMESHFNDVHSAARCIVERTIGILKARWKLLCNEKRSRYTPEKMAMFSNICSALHNICIKFKVPRYQDEYIQEPFILDIDDFEESQISRIGYKIRDQIKCSLWTNR